MTKCSSIPRSVHCLPRYLLACQAYDKLRSMHYYPFMRLLLVEDELDIQGFLRCSLEEASYQVEAAVDGKTAERLAIEGVYDILIVDLGLPDMDGITLILRLRKIGVKAPVLILSARRSVDDRV